MSSRGKLVLSVALALAAAPTIGIDGAPFSARSACAENASLSPGEAESRRLRAYSAELLKEIQALRADLAASEQARRRTESLLAEAARRSQQQCEERQPSRVPEPAHHESAAPADEARPLRSYNADLLKEVERLHADLAASEEARRKTEVLLAETSRSSRQLREEKQATYARETVRHEKEVVTAHNQVESVKTEEARQAARVAELETQLGNLRGASVQGEAQKKKLRADIAALEETLGGARSELASLRVKGARQAARATQLAAQLYAVSRENSTLSQQVTQLRAAKDEVRKLQARFREKEIRIQELTHANRLRPRELRGLRSDQKSIESALRHARSKQAASAGSLSQTLIAAARPPAPSPADGVAKQELTEGDSADLREQLSIERERRETLEQEIQRLTSSGDPEEKFLGVWKALQTARAEILVLSNQLADERRSREDLEVALTHVSAPSGKASGGAKDVAQRLTATLGERRAQADQLAEQLKAANDVITGLRARLEADESPAAESKVLAGLDEDNQRLRKALTAAEEANRGLRAKAELAERLAEMVYGKGR